MKCSLVDGRSLTCFFLLFLSSCGCVNSSGLDANSVYLVEVQSVQFVYPTVRLDVGSSDKVVARMLNGTDEFLPQPLRLHPVQVAVYYDPEARFNPLSMLRNPMVLMMIVMLGCTTLLPKAMESMDPEALREGQELLHGTAAGAGGEDAGRAAVGASSSAAPATFGANVRRLRK